MTTNRSKFATAIVGIAVAAQVILSQARAEVTLPAASAGSRVTVITDVMSPLTQSFSKPIKGSYAAFYNIASLHIDRNIVDMFENTLRPKYQIVESVVDIQRLRDKTRDLYLEKGRSLPMLQEVGIVPADYVVYITESRHGPKTSCDLYGEGEPYKGPIQDIVIYELEGKTGLVYGIASQVDVLVLDKNFTIIAASYPACASVPLPIELWPDPLVTKDDAYAFQNLLMKLVLIKDILVKTVTEAALNAVKSLDSDGGKPDFRTNEGPRGAGIGGGMGANSALIGSPGTTPPRSLVPPNYPHPPPPAYYSPENSRPEK